MRLDSLDAARRDLDTAIVLNPSLQAAYFNRAKLGLREALKGASPAAAIADVEAAVRLGPISAELCSRRCAFARVGAQRILTATTPL